MFSVIYGWGSGLGIQTTIFLGVLAGVLTAIVIYFFKVVFHKVIIPFYQKIQYQGADISGSWAYIEENTEPDYNQSNALKLSLILRQNAHNINGCMHYINNQNGKNESLEFDVYGNYWETYLSLTCRSKDPKVFSGGVLYLKSQSNGSRLNGSILFRCATTDTVVSVPVDFQCQNYIS